MASYHDSLKLVQALDDSAPGPFERSAWLALLAEKADTPVFVGDSNPAPSTILALSQNGDRLDALTNWYAFTWRPAGTGDATSLARIAKDLKKQASRVVLAPLPGEDGTATRLEHAFRQAGWSVRLAPCDHNHVLPVGGRSFDEYWAQRPGKMRTTLKRKAKKVETVVHTAFDTAAWDAYEEIYRNSWKPEEGDPALLRAFAQAEGAAGRIRLGIATFEGTPVAAQFWTVEKGVAYIHKLAHLEEHKPLSAGTTLSAALFRHVIDIDKVDLVDFGTGNDPYKRDWMELDRPRYRLDCLNPARPAAWLPLAKRFASQLARRGTRG